jgi:hypothetical protein
LQAEQNPRWLGHRVEWRTKNEEQRLRSDLVARQRGKCTDDETNLNRGKSMSGDGAEPNSQSWSEPQTKSW